MANYGCQKCGSTQSAMEMRRGVVTIGLNKELQSAGVISVLRCLNDQCGALSTASNLEIGNVVGLIPTPPAQPAPQPAPEVEEPERVEGRLPDGTLVEDVPKNPEG